MQQQPLSASPVEIPPPSLLIDMARSDETSSSTVSSTQSSLFSASRPSDAPTPASGLSPFNYRAANARDDQISDLSASPPLSASSTGSFGRRSPVFSRPLMAPFMVSAPGKVIVYGEHAVVHKRPAIAASISLRSYLLVHFLSKSHRTVSLLFPDIGLSHCWEIGKLPWAEFSRPERRRRYTDKVESLDQDLLKALEPFIEEVSRECTDDIRKIHKYSATAFLYLFLSLGSKSSPACVYTLRSTIPIGAGLGSSASISVCLASALLKQIRALGGPHPDQPVEECVTNVERINNWAYVAEMCIHGKPSGIDNTVSSGGKAVVFRRTKFERLQRFPELPLLLVNTRQPRSTAAEIRKVSDALQRWPAVVNPILDAIGEITTRAHDLITSRDPESEDEGMLEELGRLAALNHGLLSTLGVSHPRLERVRELIDEAGVGWTKLTGAGGGGCAISILWSQPSEDRRLREGSRKVPIPDSLKQKLEAENFEYFTTTLAGDGVGVLDPAVLHNISGEEGGQEIDQEKFLNAKGNDGIEQLVGVSNAGCGLAVGEWNFWRY